MNKTRSEPTSALLKPFYAKNIEKISDKKEESLIKNMQDTKLQTIEEVQIKKDWSSAEKK